MQLRNLLRIGAGVLLVAGTSTLVLPDDAQGYSTLGFSLGLSQRDFRVYNSFADPTSNDNTTPDSNFPGYIGANLAFWKSGVEWGSRPHNNTGAGDPLQSQLGDGNANFTFFWNGEATGVGQIGYNIISPIGGSPGGVLAFMQGGANGWWVRFYDAWTWDDGPGTVGNRFDLQAVGCHELGHSLGLGHSGTSGATMSSGTAAGQTFKRSIEADDRAGIQFIYGVRDDSKMPWIDSISGSTLPGGTAVLTGGNYSTSNNEVWLNSATLNALNSGGDPKKVTGLASTAGGTQISFTVPNSGAESGDVVVKKNTSGGFALSEPHAIDLGSIIKDTILLSGPNVVFIRTNATWDYSGAPPSSPTWLLYSLNNNGTTINGQPFDIGDPVHTAATGTSDAAGAGSFTVFIPRRGQGLTVYIEVRADSGGQTFDSNMLTVQVF